MNAFKYFLFMIVLLLPVNSALAYFQKDSPLSFTYTGSGVCISINIAAKIKLDEDAELKKVTALSAMNLVTGGQLVIFIVALEDNLLLVIPDYHKQDQRELANQGGLDALPGLGKVFEGGGRSFIDPMAEALPDQIFLSSNLAPAQYQFIQHIGPVSFNLVIFFEDEFTRVGDTYVPVACSTVADHLSCEPFDIIEEQSFESRGNPSEEG